MLLEGRLHEAFWGRRGINGLGAVGSPNSSWSAGTPQEGTLTSAETPCPCVPHCLMLINPAFLKLRPSPQSSRALLSWAGEG